MDNFTYYSPTLFEFGRGAEEKVGMMTYLTGATKVMIVYGRNYAKKNGLISRISNSLNTLGIEHVELGGVQPNPTDELVYEGIKLARAKKIDGLLAVGGGSVIDTAKAIAAGVPYKGDFWDFFSGKAQVEEALPVGVILTIPGSGSEGSGNCVITKTDGAVKLSLRTDSILKPRFAIMNPEMTSSLSAKQTAIGVVDMMVHIMERYFSITTRVEVTDRLAEGLLMALMTEAPKALADPSDYQARANIEWAGTLAHNGLGVALYGTRNKRPLPRCRPRSGTCRSAACVDVLHGTSQALESGAVGPTYLRCRCARRPFGGHRNSSFTQGLFYRRASYADHVQGSRHRKSRH